MLQQSLQRRHVGNNGFISVSDSRNDYGDSGDGHALPPMSAISPISPMAVQQDAGGRRGDQNRQSRAMSVRLGILIVGLYGYFFLCNRMLDGALLLSQTGGSYVANGMDETRSRGGRGDDKWTSLDRTESWDATGRSSHTVRAMQLMRIPPPDEQFFRRLEESLIEKWKDADARIFVPEAIESARMEWDDAGSAKTAFLNVSRVELPNVIRRRSLPTLHPEDVVLCTHLSVPKFANLMLQLQYWNGPSSIVVHIASVEQIRDFVHELRIRWQHSYGDENDAKRSDAAFLLNQASFHVVMEGGARGDVMTMTMTSPSSATEKRRKFEQIIRSSYPHNILRNLAMNHCGADYFVGLDVDLIPSPNLHDALIRRIHPNMHEQLYSCDSIVAAEPNADRPDGVKGDLVPNLNMYADGTQHERHASPSAKVGDSTNDKKETRSKDEIAKANRRFQRQLDAGKYPLRDALRTRKVVFVVPAYSVFARDDGGDATLPQTPLEVVSRVHEGSMMGFKLDVWNQGHLPTNYGRWERFAKADKPTSDPYFHIGYRLQFEPYVLASRRNLDRNDGRVNRLPQLWSSFRGYGYNKFSWFIELHLDGYEFATLRQVWASHLDHSVVSNDRRNHNNAYNRVRYQDFLRHLNATYGPTMRPKYKLPKEKLLWSF